VGNITVGFLASLPTADRRRLLDRAREVTDASERWLRDYPVVRRGSVTAACGLIATVGMPMLAVPELSLLTRWWLWIFGVDDVFDDLAVPDEVVQAWGARFHHPGHHAPDLLLSAFDANRRDLARYPLFDCLGGAWDDGMAAIVRGMLVERRWHRALAAEDLPSYEAYLDNGMTTIAVRPYTITACVVGGERAAARAFDVLDPMILAAARCFRLANDLRSDARERDEGKLNAVSLLQRTCAADGIAEDQALNAARTRLRETCAADLAYLDQAHRSAPREVGTLARFLWAHTAFVWDMYQFYDYDTMSTLLRERAIT
jgi:hypothetical protein